MGRDKAFIDVDGRPMATIVQQALEAAGAVEVLGVGGDLARLSALGMHAIEDDHPGEGPLGGILTALRRAGTDIVVVVSCDLPHSRPGEITRVFNALSADADAAVPVVNDRAEPLHAAYRRSCLPVLEQAFEAGERAPRRALADLRVVPVIGVDAGAVRSANRPADLSGGTD
jgi:molybdopterin-guanine dinucleotide biosynthesis protein A